MATDSELAARQLDRLASQIFACSPIKLLIEVESAAFQMARIERWIDRAEYVDRLLAAALAVDQTVRDSIELALGDGIEQGIECPIESITELSIVERVTSAFISRCLADVAPEPIKWLWPQRLALGKLSLIAGQPGLGKSQLTALMAATVSQGLKWPDGSASPSGNVLFVSCEDDAADTIKPRLLAAGADCKRIHILDWILEQSGAKRQECSFDISRHVEQLKSLALQVSKVRLIVIDPISAYLGSTDSHKTSDVRATLLPLQMLAADIGASIVLVSHLNKGAGDASAIARVSGSGAFVAACRSAWLVASHPEDADQRVFLPLKNNVGDDRTGFSYMIEGTSLSGGIDTSRIVFSSEPVEIAAEDALQSGANPRSKLEAAKKFLLDELCRGPRQATELQVEAKSRHIASWRTIETAKRQLGVASEKSALEEGWMWSLPAPKTANRTEDRKDRNPQRTDYAAELGA